MRIAMVGLRGVPATVGGIERSVEELGMRLAARGHHVTVFCRTNYVLERLPVFRGMHLRHLPTIGTKHLDAITHTALSTVAALRGFDVIHFHALGPGLCAPLPRAISPRTAVVQTVHGLDGERAKWGPTARRVLRFAAWLSAHVPDETIVVSRSLADHYRARYGRETTVIPNGVTAVTPRPAELIAARYGLRRGGYLLFTGRLVPEKQPDLLIRAFRGLEGGIRLVVAGGSSYSDEYVAELHRLAAGDDRVVFTGHVGGAVLDELYSNALAFVIPSALEGAPLVLLEAISTGMPVVASDIAPHLEILGDDAFGRRLFRAGEAGSLLDAIRLVVADGEDGRRAARELGDRVTAEYGWERSATATEAVYERAVARRRRDR